MSRHVHRTHAGAACGLRLLGFRKVFGLVVHGSEVVEDIGVSTRMGSFIQDPPTHSVGGVVEATVLSHINNQPSTLWQPLRPDVDERWDCRLRLWAFLQAQ